MVDIEKLKALAEAATPQNFDSAEEKIQNGYIECPHCGGQGEVEMEADYCNYDDAAIGVQFYGIGNEFGAAEAYYRAANPAAVLELIAEVIKLRRTVAHRDKIIELQSGDNGRLILLNNLRSCANAKLKAENEDGLAVIRTQKQQLDCYIRDAERYRLLRDEKFHPGSLSSDPDKARWLDEYLMCGDKLDAAIDEQLAKSK